MTEAGAERGCGAEQEVLAGRASPQVLDYLLRRRSTPVRILGLPGPDEGQIRTMLMAAARVPDHGKLFPWRFVVFVGAAREQAGDILRRGWVAREPGASPAKLDLEAQRFLRAPVVVGVISRLRAGKANVWEQTLSAGAVCQTLCLAANAMGFGTNWLTEWYAYSPVFREGIGLEDRERVAGFIYIGTPKEMPEERQRPDVEALTRFWAPGALRQPTDSYDRAEGSVPVWPEGLSSESPT
ncbi:MAG TPA: nitroreductase [Alphaproteobacteria bacterium]|nr:nitroreductase [Alphaproteobacteria bacterium]